MSQQLRALSFVSVALATFFVFSNDGFAVTILGNWETGASDGFIDWSNGQVPIDTSARFAFNATGATGGSSMAAQFTLAGGFTQWASIKLQSNGVADYRPDFFANSKFVVDLTLIGSEQDPVSTNDFANFGAFINTQTYGFQNQGAPDTGLASFNPQLLNSQGGTIQVRQVWDYGQLVQSGQILPTDGWVEIGLDTFSNGPVVYHIDRFRLIPEPAALVMAGLAAPALLLAMRRRRGW